MFNVSNKLTRIVGTAAAVLGVAMFMPVAFAANSIVNNIVVTPDPFHSQIPGHEADSKVTITYDWNAGGYTTGDVTEVIKDSGNNVVYYWGATEGADARATVGAHTDSISLTWDGKANTGAMSGQYVPDGTYTFDVLSHVMSPPDVEKTATFQLAQTMQPGIMWNPQPASTYDPTAGNYVVNYVLTKNSASTVVVNLKIDGPSGSSSKTTTVSSPTLSADGNYSLTWDGKFSGVIAAPGNYSFSLQGTGDVDGFDVLSPDATGTFTVSGAAQSSASIDNLIATPNPYDTSAGNMNLSFDLVSNNSMNTIKAAVYKASDMSNAVASWDFTNLATSTKSISWNGKKTSDNSVVDNGSYVFKVSGTVESTSLSNQTGFTVNTTPATPSNKCAGFTDLSSSDTDCAAFQYVKSVGAMTGNPDGSFAPESSLQRDQVAKIVLETFGKFDSAASYCNGSGAFPDVTSSSWAYQYICRGVNLGIITGYKAGADAGFYRPARSVNRVEFLALLLRNLSEAMPSNNVSSYSDVPLGQWYTGYARYSMDHNLFTGNNLYGTSDTTRREVAETIYKLHMLGKI